MYVLTFFVITTLAVQAYATVGHHPSYGQTPDQCQSKSDCNYHEYCVRICTASGYESSCRQACVAEPIPVQKIPCHYDSECHYNQYCGPYKTCECNVGYKVDPYKPSSCISAYSAAQLQPAAHHPYPPPASSYQQQPQHSYPPPANAYQPPPQHSYTPPANTYEQPQHLYSAPINTYQATHYPAPEPAVAYPPAQQLPGYQHELKAVKFEPAIPHHYPPPSPYGGRKARSLVKTYFKLD